MALPQSNATLTELRGTVGGAGPSLDTWDDPDVPGDELADEGPSEWSGAVEAYYRIRRDRQMGGMGGADDRVVMREIIFANADVPTELVEGETLVFTFEGDVIRGRAKIVERRALPGIPPALQTTRVTLEDE